MRTDLTVGRIRAARAIAVVADMVQIGLFPLFVEGGLSYLNDALDVGVAIAMIWLLGFHWAFLPSVLAETVPALNLAPTWTAAVLFATRGGATEPPRPAPGPAPGPVVDVEARRIDEPPQR